MKRLRELIRRNMLTFLIVMSMLAGIACGLILGETAGELRFIGTIFFRLIQMSIIPFVMGQIIEAVGSLTKEQLSKSGIAAIALFFVSSVIASAFGILMCTVFRPGADFGTVTTGTSEVEVVNQSVQDMLTRLVPQNIFESMSSGSIIQVILFSLFLGFAISRYSTKHGASAFIGLIHEINELLMSVIQTVMRAAPIGVFAYVATTVGTLGEQAVGALVKYMVVFGLSVALFMVAWLALISLSCKLSPSRLVRKMLPMSLMAMATTSSAVTLPLEMQDAKEKLGLDADIASLVLPLGMPLNSNGAAMYISFTAIMVSQIYGLDFSGPYLAYIAIVSMLLSLANAVVPGAGVVSLTMMAPQFGLPLESIAIFAGIDWIMGVFRTVLNVNSDVFCALLVARLEGKIDYERFNA